MLQVNNMLEVLIRVFDEALGDAASMFEPMGPLVAELKEGRQSGW
jgi:hypothetical protein